NIRRNAVSLQSQLQKRGLTAELLDRPGANPLVFAERRVPAAQRTLLIYAHYDGQPVEPLSDWIINPWEATLFSRLASAGGEKRNWPTPGSRLNPEWRLYGRSAADDKAPIVAMLTVLDALEQARIAPTSNLRF